MMRELIRREAVSQRLLRFPDGERRLTNVFHLVELLQAREDEGDVGMASLIHWLADRRRAKTEAEEAQLRLESDENLVKIATVHKSKGLQYPIVFCPFLWDGRIHADEAETLLYHDPKADYRATLDLGSPRHAEVRAHARREEMAENLRVAYVALTRARHRCYAVWGHVRDGKTAPLAYWLHQPRDLGDDPMAAVAAHVGSLGAADIQADLDRVVRASRGTITADPIPQETPGVFAPPMLPPELLHARAFGGNLSVPWRIASFSGLVRETEDAADWLHLDDDTAPPRYIPRAVGAADIGRFPRGARAGQCLHDLFRRVDFASFHDGKEPIVSAVLAAHGFDAGWAPAVVGMLQRVLDCPLDPADSKLRLRSVARDDRLDELEFHYPVSGVTDAGLRSLLLAHEYGTGTRIGGEVERLAFLPVEGFMRGFVDLIFRWQERFYLVDYKSNWLGDGPEEYRADRLADVMAREAYYLQSLIYLVALHRYLGHRVPGYEYERHVGGIFYLFLRGMDPQQGAEAGIYRDRPEEALVLTLDRYLATGSEP
jgi:exodeoxyribonuclease V beta subunit